MQLLLAQVPHEWEVVFAPQRCVAFVPDMGVAFVSERGHSSLYLCLSRLSVGWPLCLSCIPYMREPLVLMGSPHGRWGDRVGETTACGVGLGHAHQDPAIKSRVRCRNTREK